MKNKINEIQSRMDVWIQQISMLKEQSEEEGEKKENLKEKLFKIEIEMWSNNKNLKIAKKNGMEEVLEGIMEIRFLELKRKMTKILHLYTLQ